MLEKEFGNSMKLQKNAQFDSPNAHTTTNSHVQRVGNSSQYGSIPNIDPTYRNGQISMDTSFRMTSSTTLKDSLCRIATDVAKHAATWSAFGFTDCDAQLMEIHIMPPNTRNILQE